MWYKINTKYLPGIECLPQSATSANCCIDDGQADSIVWCCQIYENSSKSETESIYYKLPLEIFLNYKELENLRTVIISLNK